jgi:RNA polymerase subunit RPABC4/transcription elongation factor Spt4
VNLDSDFVTIGRNLGFFFFVVFWVATAYWVYKDARRRIEDPWMVGMATVLGAIPPFIGPIIYMFFRPPEYLEDVRERELEIKAMEKRLALRDLHCPVCRAEVDATFLVCPVCTTKLKQACVNCKQPLEALWQICPYCETRVETPAAIDFGDTWETPRRRRAE